MGSPGVRAQMALLLLLLVHSVSAFMCPPEEKERAARLEGEECGGFCGQRGVCAKGLVCDTPLLRTGLPTGVANALSFNSGGRCARMKGKAEPIDPLDASPATIAEGTLVVEEKENSSPTARNLSTVCAGCVSSRDPNDQDVVEAAKAAIALNKVAEAGSPELVYVRVVSASSQVVSGIKFILVVEVQGAAEGTTDRYDVEIISQPWRDPKWVLNKFIKEA